MTAEEFGVRYGYPMCCINAWKLNKHFSTRSGPRKLSSSGYIPCITCNEKSEEDLVNTINLNRFKCFYKFKPYEKRL